MPHVIQLQINPPVYLAGLDPALHRTFRRDHALVFMTLPSSDQVKHCTDHFPEAHVVEVQPAPAAEKRASAYYAIKLNETEYYDGDPRRWTIPSSDNPNSAALFAQFIWAESIAKSLQDRWTGAHVVPAPGMVEVQTEPVRLAFVDPIQDACKRTYGSIAERVVEVQPEPSKADVHKDLSRYIREVWRALPEGFHRSGELPADVAKLAKAYEETKLKAEFLAQGNQEWSDQVAAIQEENAKLKADHQKLTHQLHVYQDEANRAWAELPKTAEDYLPDAIKSALAAKPEPMAEGWQLAGTSELDAMVDGALYSMGANISGNSDCIMHIRGGTVRSWRDALRLMREHARDMDEARLEAQEQIAALKAKPEPVADAEISAVLDEMRGYRRGTFAICGRAVQNWHDTLQAVGAELVIARESLEQVTKVKDEMRDGRDSAVKVMRALTEELAQFKVTLEAVTKERDALHATEGMLVQDLDDAIKDRDDARTALDDARDRLKLMTNMRIGAEKDRDYCQSKRIEAEKERDDALSKLETIRKLTEEAP